MTLPSATADELAARVREHLRAWYDVPIVLVRDGWVEVPAGNAVDRARESVGEGAQLIRAIDEATLPWTTIPDSGLRLWRTHGLAVDDTGSRGELVTELAYGDPPVQVVYEHEGWTLAKAADGATGWIAPGELKGASIRVPAPTLTSTVDSPTRIADVAEGFLGLPYRWGGTTRAGVDCSGLVQRAAWVAGAAWLPRHSRHLLKVGRRVPLGQLGRGDVLVLKSLGTSTEAADDQGGGTVLGGPARHPMHVAIATGTDEVIHASRNTWSVVRESLDSLLTRYRVLGVRRLDGGAPREALTPRSERLQHVRSVILDGPRNRPFHVLGAGSAEGVAVARLACAAGFEHVVLHDTRSREDVERSIRTTHGAWSRRQQAQIIAEIALLLNSARLEDEFGSAIEPGAIVSRGQGWYLDADIRERIERALPADVELVAMAELYLALADGPAAAVTGTNGKSTTVEFVDAILTEAGVVHGTAGNERSSRQFLPELVDPARRAQLLLLEISNRQLMQVVDSPLVAGITALTPDHLDEHGGWEGYREVKRALFSRQRPCDGVAPVAVAAARDAEAVDAALATSGVVVLAGDARDVSGALDRVPSERRGSVGQIVWDEDGLSAHNVPVCFDVAGKLDRRRVGERLWSGKLAARTDLTLGGAHNRSNVAVGVGIALALGVPGSCVGPAIRGFRGKKLRGEQIAMLGSIPVISDVKSTTPEATIAAVDAVHPLRPIVIAGGSNKGLSYSRLAAQLVDVGARVALVPGDASDALAEELQRCGIGQAPLRADTIAEALRWAASTATDGDAIIVSPAAAGFWTTQLQGGPTLKALVRELVASHASV